MKDLLEDTSRACVDIYAEVFRRVAGLSPVFTIRMWTLSSQGKRALIGQGICACALYVTVQDVSLEIVVLFFYFCLMFVVAVRK
jgi:hypothetical protein